jgi:hypothetical protein
LRTGRAEKNIWEVVGEWRKVHNEEIQCLYCSPDIISAIKSKDLMVEVFRTLNGVKNTYKIVVVTPERKTLIGRLRCRWENSIKMDII